MFTNPSLKETVSYLFSDCIKEYEGKRVFHILSLQEYTQLKSENLEEVDPEEEADIGFHIEDFFNHLGASRDSTILIYSHMLDSTQTFMMKHCQGYQNIVCTADIQTSGKGVVCEEE